jgi:hypothetical protein
VIRYEIYYINTKKGKNMNFFTKSKKTITFFPTNKNAEISIDPPSQAKDHLSEEYKRLPYKVNKTFLYLHPNLRNTNLTAKACIPVLDAFTAGYMVTLPCDITATTNAEYNHRMIWEVDWEVLGTHGNVQIGDIKVPYGFEMNPYKFETKWVIKTPPGYSVLITHPLNRFDLPFITMSAVVDSDTYNILPINLPFFLKYPIYSRASINSFISYSFLVVISALLSLDCTADHFQSLGLVPSGNVIDLSSKITVIGYQ